MFLIVSILICEIGFTFTSYLQGMPIYDIQNAKFLTSLKYGFVSMFIILTTKYFEGKIDRFNPFVVHIGKNAIWYYFAQGVGSSISYYIVNILILNNWFLKWIITYVINIAVTSVIAEALAHSYKILNDCILMAKGNYCK